MATIQVYNAAPDTDPIRSYLFDKHFNVVTVCRTFIVPATLSMCLLTVNWSGVVVFSHS